MNTRIVFFGTPEFAAPALGALREAGYDIVAVVTQPDKPAGRGMLPTPSPIKKLAMDLNIPILQPATLKNAHTLRALQSFDAETAICVAYGKIIPREIIDVFPKGILNIHPSLLPKYRGPSPIQSAILSGDPESGVTLMLLDEEMDHGPILAQVKIGITPKDTGLSLNKTLSEHGAKLLVETLPTYLAGEIAPQPQDHAKATMTKMLERADGKIDWQKSAVDIERMVRAYDLWPGTYTIFQGKPAQISPREKFQSGKRLKVLKASLLHPTVGCAANSTPGYIFKPDRTTPNPSPHSIAGKGNESISSPFQGEAGRGSNKAELAVNCNPGSILLEQVQLEGKKPISDAEFMRGHPDILQTILQ